MAQLKRWAKMKKIITTLFLLFALAAYAKDDFSKSLINEASAYLTKKESQKISAEIELLRKAPTQSGIAYPKYYIWVRGVNPENKTITEGAMRLAEIENSNFKITDFVTRDSIISDPLQLDMIFPKALVPLIRQKAERK